MFIPTLESDFKRRKILVELLETISMIKDPKILNHILYFAKEFAVPADAPLTLDEFFNMIDTEEAIKIQKIINKNKENFLAKDQVNEICEKPINEQMRPAPGIGDSVRQKASRTA